MKKIYLGLITILTLFTACSDVDLEPMNSSALSKNRFCSSKLILFRNSGEAVISVSTMITL